MEGLVGYMIGALIILILYGVVAVLASHAITWRYKPTTDEFTSEKAARFKRAEAVYEARQRQKQREQEHPNEAWVMSKRMGRYLPPPP